MSGFIAFGLMLAGGLSLLVVVLGERSRNRTLKRRVDKLALGAAGQLKQIASMKVRRWLAALDRRVRAFFAYRMARSWGVSTKSTYLMLVGLIAAIGTWGLAHIALHLPNFVAWMAGAISFYLAPRLMLNREQHRADAQFSELLPDTVDMVVRMVRAGLPVAGAIRTAGTEAEPPLSTVFSAIADLAEIGVPLSEALTKTTEAVGNPDFSFFGVAVALQQSTGGNLAATLETLSEIVRRRRAVRLKARAATAEIRISAIVLSCIPFFIVGALLIVSPGYLEPLISDPRGNLIVGAAVLSLLLGGLTMRAMMRAAMSE